MPFFSGINRTGSEHILKPDHFHPQNKLLLDDFGHRDVPLSVNSMNCFSLQDAFRSNKIPNTQQFPSMEFNGKHVEKSIHAFKEVTQFCHLFRLLRRNIAVKNKRLIKLMLHYKGVNIQMMVLVGLEMCLLNLSPRKACGNPIPIKWATAMVTPAGNCPLPKRSSEGLFRN